MKSGMNIKNISASIIMIFLFLITGMNSCTVKTGVNESVKDVMDRTVTRLYHTMNEQQLDSLNNDKALALFNKNDKETLATRYWMFDVNVPVTVSVMRSTKQKIIPFWLPSAGFVKTDKTMNNEQVTYEVWQKKFEAGHVGLGINGFEDYMLHYFVSVAPVNKNDELQLSNFFPANQHVAVLRDSAFTYHDWTELVLRNVPENMKGQKLLTTIRGRGTETHLVGAFRKTIFPSSANPDQVMLTWSADPATTIDI